MLTVSRLVHPLNTVADIVTGFIVSEITLTKLVQPSNAYVHMFVHVLPIYIFVICVLSIPTFVYVVEFIVASFVTNICSSLFESK